MEHSADLKEADSAFKRAEEEDAAAAVVRTTVESRKRAEVARRRKEIRKRCSIGSLTDVLQGFDLPLDFFATAIQQDRWDGSGKDPAAAHPPSSAAADAAGEDEADPQLHLRPLPLDKEQGHSVPVALWRAGPLSAEARPQVAFRRYAVQGDSKRRHHQIIGTCEGAPMLLARGVRAHKPSIYEPRYLVGGRAAGSRRLFLFEAELYHVDREMRRTFVAEEGDGSGLEDEVHQKKQDSEEEPTGPPQTYFQQKIATTGAFGAAKKQRMINKAVQKMKKRTFMELDSYAQTLTQRVESLEANLVNLEERNETARKKFLPPYDPNASDPHLIYKEGLRTIAPKQMYVDEASLLDEEMVNFLVKAANEPLRAVLENVPGKSKFLAAVVTARATNAAQHITKKDAEALARRCEVLNRLLTLYKGGSRAGRGVTRAKGVAKIVGLPEESQLARHWHRTYYDEIVGQRAERSFNGKKLLAAVAVWALHLTPTLSLDFSNEVEDDLHVPRGELKTTFENIGCSVSTSAVDQDTSVKLVQPPTMDMEKYKMMNMLGGPKKKRRGGGRGGR